MQNRYRSLLVGVVVAVSVVFGGLFFPIVSWATESLPFESIRLVEVKFGRVGTEAEPIFYPSHLPFTIHPGGVGVDGLDPSWGLVAQGLFTYQPGTLELISNYPHELDLVGVDCAGKEVSRVRVGIRLREPVPPNSSSCWVEMAGALNPLDPEQSPLPVVVVLDSSCWGWGQRAYGLFVPKDGTFRFTLPGGMVDLIKERGQ